jgi:HEAT repeat protein
MRRFATVCLLTLIALAGCLSVPDLEKPTSIYKGQPLAYWVKKLPKAPNEAEQRQAAEAIHSFGADAVPSLIPMLDDRSVELRRLVISLLRPLGPQARDAVPALVRLLKQSNNMDESRDVIETLASIGPDAKDAVSVLTAKLDDSWLRLRAVSALGQIGPSARSALPALRIALLEAIKKPAESEPRFTLEERPPTNQEMIEGVIATLGCLGSVSVSTLKELAERPDLNLAGKIVVVNTLGKLGPAAKETAPLLKTFLKSDEPGLRSVSAIALWRIQKDTEAITVAGPILKDAVVRAEGRAVAMQSPEWQLTHGFFEERPRADVLTEEALGRLVELMGEIGPPAKSNLPELRRLCSCPGSSVREAAAVAIQKVNPGEKIEKGDEKPRPWAYRD